MKSIPEFPDYFIFPDGNIKKSDGTLVNLYVGGSGYWYVSLKQNNIRKRFSVHRLVAKAYLPNPKNLEQVNHINGIKTDCHVSNLEWCTRNHNSKHAYQIGLINREKNLTETDLDNVLNQFLKGISLTVLAKQYKTGLSRLTINVRTHAYKTNKLILFKEQLCLQKTKRNQGVGIKLKKPIMCFSKEGAYIKTYAGCQEAAEALNKKSAGAISACALSYQKSAYGFVWKYV